MLKKPIILPEGYPFIIVALLLGGIGLWMKWYYAAVVPFVLAVYFTYFFRCPPRNDKITPGDDVLVSPADGTVVDVCHDAKEDMFLGQTCHKITIFLSIFDVHCNRSPMEGKITYQSYTQGKFLPAYEEGVGFENERGAIGITGKNRSILVILIAGILARRVVSWKNLGDSLKKGELYGMIKFGSCTELYTSRAMVMERVSPAACFCIRVPRSSLEAISVPSTLTMRSPACRPAFSAGPPLTTSTT